MKQKSIFWGIALGIFSLLLNLPVEAQRYKKKPLEDPQVERTDSTGKPRLIDRFVFGGNFMAVFGTSTYVDLSPLIGYRYTPKLIIGGGVTYIYWNNAYTDAFGRVLFREKFNVYGGRVFTQYDLLSSVLSHGDKIFTTLEYEGLNVPYIPSYASYPYPTSRRWIGNPFLGAGYRSPLGARSFANISVLYNLNYQNNYRYNIYSSPWKINIGFMF